MTKSQRRLVIAVLIGLALILVLYFLHFGTRGPYMWPVLTFGEFEDEWGIFSMNSGNLYATLTGGIVVPILLLASAAYLYLGSKR